MVQNPQSRVASANNRFTTCLNLYERSKMPSECTCFPFIDRETLPHNISENDIITIESGDIGSRSGLLIVFCDACQGFMNLRSSCKRLVGVYHHLLALYTGYTVYTSVSGVDIALQLTLLPLKLVDDLPCLLKEDTETARHLLVAYNR